MKRKVRLISILLILAMSFTLVACSGTTPETSTPSESVDKQDAASKTLDEGIPAEAVTISILHYFTPSETITQAFRPSFEQFQQENPSITFEEEVLSAVDLTTKVQTLAAADELPDVFCLKGQMGATYAIPFQVTNTCVFYNADIFEAAGVTQFPETWEDFLTCIEKIKATGVTPITLGNKDRWQAFMNGKTAMSIDGTWEISELDENAPQRCCKAPSTPCCTTMS